MRPPTEMGLRVADALMPIILRSALNEEHGNDVYLEAARAAIRAMREPTKEMLDATGAIRRWSVMVDAAAPARIGD